MPNDVNITDGANEAKNTDEAKKAAESIKVNAAYLSKIVSNVKKKALVESELEDKRARRRPPKRKLLLSRLLDTLPAKRTKGLKISLAALGELQIVIRYVKTTTGQIKKYIVCPYEFEYKRTRNGIRKVLWAYDMFDEHIKTFVFRNVMDVDITDRRFKPKWPVKIR